MKKNLIFAGIDDGFMETKIVLLDQGITLRIPSQIKAGVLNQINISGAQTGVSAYECDDGSFIVGAIDETDTTKQDEYPVSGMNRILVAHALAECGLTDGQEVVACSGLPVNRFYKGNVLNKPLIKAKQKNLLKNDVKAQDGRNLAKIVRHQVQSEAIAAWLDVVLKREDGQIVPDKEAIQQKTAIIDMGGRTVDIAVIQNYNLDVSRSSTIEVGMLDVQDSLRDYLQREYEVELKTHQLNRAMNEGVLRLYGKDQDVSHWVEEAKKEIVPRIKAEVMRRLGKGADLDQVIFTGGTSAALQEYLAGWFPHQIISKDPAFGNARGMAKYACYIMADNG